MLHILFPFIHMISITKSRYEQSSSRKYQQISKIETTKFYLCTKEVVLFLLTDHVWMKENDCNMGYKYKFLLLFLRNQNLSSLVFFIRVLSFFVFFSFQKPLRTISYVKKYSDGTKKIVISGISQLVIYLTRVIAYSIHKFELTL